MPSFGGVPVISVEGAVEPMRMHTRTSKRPGVFGQDYVETGVHGKPFQVTVERDYSNATDRETGYQLFLSMCGALITLVTNNGVTWHNLQVMDDMSRADSFFKVASGGLVGGRYYLEFKVTLEATRL